MYIEHLEDLSVLEFLKKSFSSYSFVTVVKGFPYTNLAIPTIAVEAQDLNATNFELGNRDWHCIREYDIDIFASSLDQRDEFAYKILNELENNVPVYDFNSTFTNPPQINTLNVTGVKVTPLFIDPELVEKLYFRTIINFVCYRVIV